ncbi:uncharacterized protein LOC114867553 isoform X2 [Betta splendens]|uniref:Uncharacterized protein LOC114867553 isoform X2 n=1 Tax=Betta splendens TaxID=158456 RepID=A0A6P7P7J4_BETSP|nr:uncharacterized protein LOC114867553 isoform X2 [Betta splendens]
MVRIIGIYLFLLLGVAAAGQGLLVSVTQLTSLEQIKESLLNSLQNLQCSKKTGCKSWESVQSKDILTLNTSGTYCCKGSNLYCRLEVQVLKGCLYVYGVEFSKNPECKINVDKQYCANACLKNQSCHFFTFNKRSKDCFLMASIDLKDINIDGNIFSGYFQKNYCTDASLADLITPFNNSDYDTGLYFYNDSRSWFYALRFCGTQNYTLVEITDGTVEDDVTNLLQNETVTQNGVWVGLERPIFGFDTTWRWITGGEVNTSQWSSSSPPSSTNKYCGKIIWVNETQTIKLLDDDCFKELPFICQDST